ncbi:MAG: ABC-F family ATP-binding cassette domain-containing protein [Ilumatobacteraceae bacterium]|nr:ABC-F family ATP-binding cassette domain-containing protein [Ilumatobacteraceae bacterium]
MGSIQVSHVGWRRPGGAELLRDINFSVGNGDRVALVGANGVGKSTLMRLIAGETAATSGTISIDGRLGVMRQLVGENEQTVRDLMVSLASQRLQDAAARLARAEAAAADDPMRYATALAEWGDAGGYDAEVFWDACCTKAIGEPFAELERRPLSTFSGGEQKRLALEALLRSDYDVLLLDEPDNFLDVPGKRWLEAELRASRKTMLFVSHDRELLAATATKIVTVEASGAWTHGSGFAGYHEARQARLENREHALALYEDERKKLEDLVVEMRRRAKISETFAPRLKAAESRLRQFLERSEAPELVREQRIDMRLGGARTGKRALAVRHLELHGLTDPFELELWYGERVAVLGGNGAGKSHFLRVLGGDDSISHSGEVRLGAGVVPGLFNQTHEHPEWNGRTLLQILHDNDVVRGPAMGMLRRYEMQGCADQIFNTLSGGQQARFQILLLELSGATLLLLDEPTDNLDLVSAEALEAGLAEFQGTVIAVTHDRWFLRGFDRFVVFNEDCAVSDHLDRPAEWR